MKTVKDALLEVYIDFFIAEYQDYLDTTKEKAELYADAAILAEEVREIREAAEYDITAEGIKNELDKRRK